MTALVPAASWSYYRALSARRCTENLTYMSNPMGLFPPSSPNPWLLYTEQGYEYVFVKVITVIMYHRFNMVACVCVNWNTNIEERVCYLALMWVLGSLYLQPNFAKTLCKWSFYWTLIGKRSHTCKRISLFTVPKCINVTLFCIEKCCVFLKDIVISYLTKYLKNIPLLILNLCRVM